MTINRREKLFFLLGGMILLLFFYYLFVVGPALSKERRLRVEISKNEKKLAQMIELKNKWERFKKARLQTEQAMSKRGKSFTLLSFLEGISRKVGIHDRIQYMKPLSSSKETGSLKLVGMEIQLDSISIGQLVRYLYEIEYSDELAKIAWIRIQKLTRGDFQSLRVTLQVETYVPSRS